MKRILNHCIPALLLLICINAYSQKSLEGFGKNKGETIRAGYRLTTNYWTGTSDGSWHNAANWSLGVVPNDTMEVTINAGTPFFCVVSAPARCRSLTIMPGANLTANNNLIIQPAPTGTILFDEEIPGTGMNISEKSRITTIEVVGGSSKSLTFPDPSPGFGASHYMPRFNSDKSLIVYHSNRNGYPNNFDIFLTNREGSFSKLVTNTPNRNESDASFSPDGSKIAYLATDENGHQQVFTNDINGENEQQITNFTHSTRQVYCVYTIWSKDGSTIYFSSNKDTTTMNAYSIKADGSDLRRISTNNNSHEFITSISPNGEKIAYHSNTASAFEIFTMNIDGSNKRQLTSIGKITGDASWSPDGNFICFLSNKDRPTGGGNYMDIFIMKADGTGLTKLTSYDSYKRYTDWK